MNNKTGKVEDKRKTKVIKTQRERVKDNVEHDSGAFT